MLTMHCSGQAAECGVKYHQGLGMMLSNLEQEETWLQGWDVLDELIERKPGGYLLFSNYKEISLGEARDWIQARSEEHTLNSSHVRISYAVFCLKKKKKKMI